MPTATIIVNTKAGAHLAAAANPLLDKLRAAGFTLRQNKGSIDQQFTASRQDPGDMVIIDGGDGTIRSALSAHRDTGIPLGIIPGGTMNLLARDYGVPITRDAAVDAIIAGHTRTVDVGLVNDRIFLHSAAIGLPVRIGIHREAQRGKMAITTKAALAMHALSTLWRDRTLLAKITAPSGTTRATTGPSFIIVLGEIGDKLIPRPTRSEIADTHLTVFALNTRSTAGIADIIVRGAVGSVTDQPGIEGEAARDVLISAPRGSRRRLYVMLDGEGRLVKLPARFSISHHAATIITAKPPASEHHNGAPPQ